MTHTPTTASARCGGDTALRRRLVTAARVECPTCAAPRFTKCRAPGGYHHERLVLATARWTSRAAEQIRR